MQPAGNPVGTEGYAAPEQEVCEPVSVAIDLYGLGMVLAEALAVLRAEGAEIPPSSLAPTIRQLRSEELPSAAPRATYWPPLANAAGELLRPWPALLDRYAAAVSQPVP